MNEELNYLRKKVKQQKIIIKVLSDRLFEKNDGTLLINSEEENKIYASITESSRENIEILKMTEIKYRQNFSLGEFIEYLKSINIFEKLIEENSRAKNFLFNNIQLKEIKIYVDINYTAIYKYLFKNINGLSFEIIYILIFILKDNNKINIFTDLILFLKNKEFLLNYLILIFFDEYKLCSGEYFEYLAEIIADILHKNNYSEIKCNGKILNMKKLILIFIERNTIELKDFTYKPFIEKILENKIELNGHILDQLKENGHILLLISQYFNFNEFYEFFFSALMKEFQRKKRCDLLYYVAVILFAMKNFNKQENEQYESAMNILLIESKNKNIEISYYSRLLLVILNILPYKKEIKITPLL